MAQEDYSRLPHDCAYFYNIQKQYEDYCKQRNVVPFQGFRTVDEMRLFHVGFWLNNATMPKKIPSSQVSLSPIWCSDRKIYL